MIARNSKSSGYLKKTIAEELLFAFQTVSVSQRLFRFGFGLINASVSFQFMYLKLCSSLKSSSLKGVCLCYINIKFFMFTIFGDYF